MAATLRRAALAAGIVLLLAALPAACATPAEAAKRPPAAAGLKAFSSCKSLLRYARRNALNRLEPALYGPVGKPPLLPQPLSRELAGRGAAPAGDFSQTNVQEAGVDEPDIVKTNGTHIFSVSRGRLRVIDLTGPAPFRVGALRLGAATQDYEILLRGTHLLAMATDEDGATAVLIEVDVSDPAVPRLVRSMKVEGSYLSARLTGGTARVVISSPAPEVGIRRPFGPTVDAFVEARRRNRAALRRSRLSRFVPSYVLRDRRARRKVKRRLVGCRAVRRATTFSGLGMLSVLTIDLDRGLPPSDTDSLMTDADTVYASPESLYLATPRWMDEDWSFARQARGMTTQIHRFDASVPGSTTYRASGRVRGFLLNQFSLSEYAGHLRVASTSEPIESDGGRDGDSESSVSVLREQEGKLVRVGHVGGLGRGERIYAVRFIGDTGYVVTFRQVDPLYTLDLSRPQSPTVLGQLKIRGYSAYLHPAGADLLIGIGQDATRAGEALGTQLSLFDVSDLRNPRRLYRRTVAASMSEVEFDHHAFLWWAPARLAVLPLQPDDFIETAARGGFTGAIGYRIGRETGIVEAGRITHGSGRRTSLIRRSIVVGSRLYTVSDAGIAVNDLGSFGRIGFVPFR